MAKPENPPAFPVRIESPAGVIDILHGMELRDWFAGQALTMSQPDKPEYLADWAYRVADALLAARKTTDREDGK